MASTLKIWVAVALALAWASWVIALAGLSDFQNKCTDAGPDPSVVPLWGLRGFSSGLDCSHIFRFYWWLLFFTFLALLVFSIFLGFAYIIARSALSWLALFTVLATLWILTSDAFLSTQQTTYYTQGNAQSYARAMSAGSIMLAAFLLLLSFLLGWKQKRAAASAGPGPIKY